MRRSSMKAVVNLLLEGLELHDSEVWIDAAQCVFDDLFKPGDGIGSLDDQGTGVQGLVFVEWVLGSLACRRAG